MRRLVVWALAAVALSAVDARAQLSMGSFQGYLTGHVGMIGGPDLSERKVAGGGAVSVQESNGWGAEFDFGIASDVAAGRQVLDVSTYMFNGSWIKPDGLVRPFAVAGAGGGAYLALRDIFGIRADARYFYSSADHAVLRRPENMSFWRVSIGATFFWSIAP
ncbi:MAG: hypothetical protein ACKOEC_16415 [Acidimicrobiia bacterium]